MKKLYTLTIRVMESNRVKVVLVHPCIFRDNEITLISISRDDNLSKVLPEFLKLLNDLLSNIKCSDSGKMQNIQAHINTAIHSIQSMQNLNKILMLSLGNSDITITLGQTMLVSNDQRI